MNDKTDKVDALLKIIEAFEIESENELKIRWEAWDKDLSKSEMYEVVGALLARQVSLAVNFSRTPELWNGHIAPVIHRAMADAYISLAWILEEPLERSQRYLYYGLGQQKLLLEHRKKQLEKDGKTADDDPMIEMYESWINSQRYTFLTEVDIGSWSGLNTRQMAEEAGCIDFYNYVYAPFSSVAHSMWNHIALYNLKPCNNPLHRHHKIPDANLNLGCDTHSFYLAAKYMNKAFKLFDKKTGVTPPDYNSFDNLYKSLQKNGLGGW